MVEGISGIIKSLNLGFQTVWMRTNEERIEKWDEMCLKRK